MVEFDLLTEIQTLDDNDFVAVLHKVNNTEYKITKKNLLKGLGVSTATPQVIRGQQGEPGPAGLKTRSKNLPVAQVLYDTDKIMITTYLKDNIETMELPKFQTLLSNKGYGFSYKFIDITEKVTIPTNKEMSVHGDLIINGDLVIDGELVLAE